MLLFLAFIYDEMQHLVKVQVVCSRKFIVARCRKTEWLYSLPAQAGSTKFAFFSREVSTARNGWVVASSRAAYPPDPVAPFSASALIQGPRPGQQATAPNESRQMMPFGQRLASRST